MSGFTPSLLSPGLILHYNCLQLLYSMLCTHGMMVFAKTLNYILEQPHPLE